MAGGRGAEVLVYYQDDGGVSSGALRTEYQSFNELASDTYTAGSRGVVTGTTVMGDVEFAQQQGMKTFATVSNYGRTDFSPEIGQAVIRSAAATKRLIADMLNVLAAGKYTGINIDFEAIPHRERAAFTKFIATVAEQMHTAGYQVMVSVPAELKDDPGDDWSGAFDLKALGKIVDVLQLMTYDENGTWGKPGPVAGLDWVTACVNYATSVAPAAKISMGIPAYGYDWDLTKPKNNTSITWIAAAALLTKTGAAAQWDAASSSPWFSYTLNGHNHVVWYENAQSIGQKVLLVGARGLNGVSIWALGMGDASFWQAIHSGGF
jgi:spore germination protein YaaH